MCAGRGGATGGVRWRVRWRGPVARDRVGSPWWSAAGPPRGNR
ncbi:hypothetical protein APASM_4077 [Actinosynnema pretiosum subsp. pretiosum]|nr:hypothetical protein APASM_4077 [Actinosynnema pretiosum subsp. pretiosum]